MLNFDENIKLKELDRKLKNVKIKKDNLKYKEIEHLIKDTPIEAQLNKYKK